jgi:hypothetical protein
MQNEQNLNAEAFGSGGIFFRESDRNRFDYVMRAVQTQSQSLALSSDSDDILDHYGRLVINKLRQMHDLQIEVFLPANTEALLERFNQILADLSLTDARNAESSPAPRRVLIAHDARAINPRELQLLARLIQDFPGANTALVLLLDKVGRQQYERSLENFGQRMLRWPVELPTHAEGEALLQLARAHGQEVEVKKLLAATGYAKETAIPAEQPFEKPPADKPIFAQQLEAARKQEGKNQQGRTEPVLNNFTPAGAKPAAADKEKSSSPPGRARQLLGLTMRWIAAIVMLIALSAGIIALLFPQRLVPMLATSPLLKQNLPPWMMEIIANAVQKPTPAIVDTDALPKPAEPALAAENTAAPTVPAISSDTVTKTELTAEKLDPAKSDASGLASPVTAQPVESVKPVPPVAKIEAVVKAGESAKNDAAAKSDAKNTSLAEASPADALAPRSERGARELVEQARPGSFFVQHVSLSSMSEAQEWRAQHAALKKSLIAAAKTPDQGVKFIVLSGPFANRKEAETFSNKPGIPANPWLRPLASLKQALQVENR